MNIREAKLDDLDSIMRVEQAVFVREAWSRPLMVDAMAADYTIFLVVVEDDVVRGYGGVGIAGDDADVQTIAIDAKCRGRGWGKALFNALEQVALDHDAQRMFLDVREDNDVAQSLYAAQGFRSIGRRLHYYQDGCAAIVMRKRFGIANGQESESDE